MEEQRNIKIITPYVNDQEIEKHMDIFWEYDIHYEKDTAKIGSDLMFEKIWNKYPEEDIFILHADMDIVPEQKDWFKKVIEYRNKYPEAGIFGCLLLYPLKNQDNEYIVQSAGGVFNEQNIPDHIGSGFDMFSKNKTKEVLVTTNSAEIHKVREVAWTTFGGCLIRRRVINKIGNFSREFEWTYNRDVDYCLQTRKANEKIYQIPVKLFHEESRDNKIEKYLDNNKILLENRNLNTLLSKWKDTIYYKNINRIVE